ncbi:CD109 antigen [Camelus dromedarius]|uniref:CD109 antigen n=1 Tax=Camelus dromedarius TaxID=9838 RepID=A0A5N4CH07_CAMDR|nr:CD109 antigen [Camelus dromedarius]
MGSGTDFVGRPKFLLTAPGIIRPGRNVTIGVELLEHSPSQITVKVELVKMLANLTVSVLEAEGVFEKEIVTTKGFELQDDTKLKKVKYLKSTF